MQGCLALKKDLAIFFHTPETSRIIASSFLPGTLRSRSKAGEDRRLRLVTDEVPGPGRFRPRVPLGHYGPGALDDALGGAGAKMPRPDEAERTETEIAGGARTSRHIV